MNEDVERRIEEARQASARQKETEEFLRGLTSNDQLLKPIYNPEAWVMREKARGAANRGELRKSECRHPLEYIQQYIDDDPSVKRDGRPVNLFACGVCGCLLWFVDPWGEAVPDA